MLPPSVSVKKSKRWTSYVISIVVWFWGAGTAFGTDHKSYSGLELSMSIGFIAFAWFVFLVITTIARLVVKPSHGISSRPVKDFGWPIALGIVALLDAITITQPSFFTGFEKSSTVVLDGGALPTFVTYLMSVGVGVAIGLYQRWIDQA